MVTGICLLAAALLLSAPHQGFGQAPPVAPEADSPQQPGSEFQVDVRVGSESSPVENLNQIGFDLEFEPENLTHVSDQAGSFLGDVQYVSNVDAGNGVVSVGITRTDDQGESGSGTVAQVTLSVEGDVADGTELAFSIQNVQAEDPNDDPIDLDPQDLNITVQEENQSPDASFTFSPSAPDVGETVSFDASGSEDPDGNIQSYEWDLDGDGQTDATGVAASTSFSSAGDKAVTLTVADGSGATGQATETITVSEGNQAPTIGTNAGLSLTEGGSAAITTSELSASDPDNSASELTYEVTSSPSQGNLLLNGSSTSSFTQQDLENGSVQYDHTASGGEDDSFEFDLTDPSGAGPTGETFSITVTEANQTPTASFTFVPNTPDVGETVTFDASGSTDSDGSIQSYEWDLDGDGQADATGQVVSTSFSSAGQKPVILTVEDDGGAIDSATETVPVGAPPVAEDDTGQTGEGKPVTTDVLVNDTDPDGSLDASSVRVESSPSNGSTTANDDGTITYAPSEGFVGTDSYTYTVADSEGARSGEATVTIEVIEKTSTPPPVPDSLVAAGGGQRVAMSWAENSSGNTAGYNIYRSTSSFNDKNEATLVNDDLVSGSPYTDTTAEGGDTYYYRLTAVNESGEESGFSNGATAQSLQEGIAVTIPEIDSDTGEVSTLGIEADLGTGNAEGYTNMSFVFDNSVLNIVAVRGGDDLGFGSEDLVFNQEGDTLRVSGLFETPVSGQGEFLQVDVKLATDTSTVFRLLPGDISRRIVGGESGLLTPTSVFDGTASGSLLLVDSTDQGSVESIEAFGSPDPPTALSVQLENGDTNLSWTASESPDVGKYRIYRGTAPIDSAAGPEGLSPLDSISAGTTAYADTGATPGTEYHYRVTAVDSAQNESGFSAEAIATPRDETPPAVPSGLTAEAVADSIVLSWEANTGGDLAGYRLYRDTVSFADTSKASLVVDTLIAETGFTDSGLASGKSYHYRVAAVDTAANQSGLSDEATATPQDGATPSPPPALTATAEARDVNLQWTSSNSPDVGKYRIYRGTAPIDSSAGPSSLTALDSTSTGTTAYTDTTGQVGQTYYYRVTAVDTAQNESGFSAGASATAEDVAPPAVPSGLATEAGRRQVRLTWDANTEADLAGYRLYRDTTSFADTSEAELITDTLVTETELTDSGLTTGQTYHYRIAAVDTAFNQSGLSDEVKATPRNTAAPSPPPSLAATAGADAIDLEWTASGSSDVESYRIYRSTAPIDSLAGPDGLSPLDSTPAGTTAYADRGATQGTKYYYRVTAVDAAQSESGFSEEATAMSEDVAPPAAPKGLVANAEGQQINLMWEGGAEADLAGYRLYRSVAEAPDTSNAPLVEGLLSETSYVDTSAAEDQAYRYGVTAVDTAGNESGLSVEASALLPPEAVEASVTRSFGDADGPQDYRLVALPGRADTSLAQVLEGEAGAQWQAYLDDGSQEGFLVRYDGSSDFRFGAGNGFWVTATDGLTFESSVPAVELKGDSARAIGLQEGWNVISNPLGKDVAWSEVQASTGADLQPLWAFGGSFDTTGTFASATEGRAYYFFNEANGPDSLVVPYPGAPETKGSRPKQIASEQATSDAAKPESASTFALSASAGDGPASKVSVGLAGPEGREKTVIAPPGRFEPVSLRIRNPESESPRTKRLMAATRVPVEEKEGHTFQVRLTSRTGGLVKLSAEGLREADVQGARLLHPKAGRTYDLREQPTVTIGPEDGLTKGEPLKLKLAVGTESYAEREAKEVLPDKISLTSYPNPVRRQGTLEYALPEVSEVSLKVYDILGREVATLQQGRKEAGRYRVALSTDRLSSGVYFGRLKAGGQTRTQKITVVR